jgi:hypothetical protein
MKLHWEIEPSDIERIRSMVEAAENAEKKGFYKDRLERNLAKEKQPITQAQFWHRLVECLLTSVQKSGPKSPVSNFSRKHPFPLRLDVCLPEIENLGSFAARVLTEFGGIRFANRIGGFLQANLKYLQSGGWEPTLAVLENVRTLQTQAAEHAAATFVDKEFKGCGPKQSRNVLQCLGLTRYEIPLDSRWTKWLNENGCPIRLAGELLGNAAYYDFVSGAIQQLCERANIYPCVLDAVIFASFDDDGWSDEDMLPTE